MPIFSSAPLFANYNNFSFFLSLSLAAHKWVWKRGTPGTLEDNSLNSFSIYLVVIRISHHSALILIIKTRRKESAKEEKSQKWLHKVKEKENKVKFSLACCGMQYASCRQWKRKRLKRRVAGTSEYYSNRVEKCKVYKIALTTLHDSTYMIVMHRWI